MYLQTWQSGLSPFVSMPKVEILWIIINNKFWQWQGSKSVAILKGHHAHLLQEANRGKDQIFLKQVGIEPQWKYHTLVLSESKKLSIRAFIWGIVCFCISIGSFRILKKACRFDWRTLYVFLKYGENIFLIKKSPESSQIIWLRYHLFVQFAVAQSIKKWAIKSSDPDLNNVQGINTW